MAILFSDYLRSLGPDPEPPSAEAFEAVLRELRRLLVRELKRRGLWNRPPRYLGIDGDYWQGEAIKELVFDCYAELFVVRLKLLKDHLLVKDDVDGLVVLGVRHYVQDRQRRNDRLGYKVYEIVSRRLEHLEKAEEIHLHPSGEKVDNGTVCAFVAGYDPEEVRELDLGPQVQALNDHLWPELLTGHGKARTDVNRRLDGHLMGLSAAGVEAFRFRDLIEPLKADVRRRWQEEVAALGEEMVARGDDESDLELRDLRDCVLRRIEAEPPASRGALHKFWSFLYDWAVGSNLDPVAEKADASGKPPTRLGLEKALGISRHRIEGLEKTLQGMIDACRSAIPGIAAVRAEVEGGLPGRITGEGSDVMSRREQLRRATGKAAARWADERVALEGDRRPPQPGDVFVFAEAGELLVEWVVVEVAPKESRLLIVPADGVPEVGSRDVALGSEGWGGIVSVRCALEGWLDARAFDPAHRTRRLTSDLLAQVRRKREGAVDPTLGEQEVDDDPRYQSRMEELAAAQTAVLATLPRSAGRVLTFRRRLRDLGFQGRSLALAASILLAVGLGGRVLWQQSELAALKRELEEAPHPNLPVLWLTGLDPERGPDDPFVMTSDARRLAVLLEVTSPAIYPRYRVEVVVVDESPPRTVWSSDQLIKSGSELSFDLPRALLTTGSYELRIYGLRTADDAAQITGEELLQTYSVWLDLGSDSD